MLKLLLVGFFISTSSALAKEKPAQPTSEIPAKREFPLNPETNPCQDFHQYVCSKAEESFKLREDRSSHTFAFDDSRERLLKVKQTFMKELPKKKNLDNRTEQVRDYYMACMNTSARAKAEKAEVKRMSQEISKIKTTSELMQYSHKTLPQGFGNLIHMWPVANKDNAKVVDAAILASLMNLRDHKYYEQADLMAAYEKHLALFLQTVSKSLKSEDATRRAQAMISLEKNFVKEYPVSAVRQKRWSEKRVSKQEDLIKKFPALHLGDILKHAPDQVLISTPIPESLEFLNNNLEKYSLETWKDIYLYRALSDYMDEAYPKYFKNRFEFSKNFFGGPNKRPELQERCTTEVSNRFTMEADAALIDQVFPHFEEEKIQEVGKRIRNSILEGLNKNKWLSAKAKKEAIKKIETARLQLVKPHTDREWDFYPIKKYSTKNYMHNAHLFNEARWEKALQELSEPANQDAWSMGPLTVNAYYSRSDNKFVLPIGILQYPFFDKDGPIIENLGAVGAVIGHELGHGIDDSGSKFDATGSLRQWMSAKDLKEFDQRGQKMIDQFNEIEHDGKLTLGENVADLVGVTFAYNAAFPNGKGALDDKKKFFEAYGRVWCSVVRPDFDKMRRRTDPHSSGKARINEQVKHQPGFAEAYQCKPGDKMTLPEKERIQIW